MAVLMTEVKRYLPQQNRQPGEAGYYSASRDARRRQLRRFENSRNAETRVIRNPSPGQTGSAGPIYPERTEVWCLLLGHNVSV
jgi:hypothetical protein